MLQFGATMDMFRSEEMQLMQVSSPGDLSCSEGFVLQLLANHCRVAADDAGGISARYRCFPGARGSAAI